MELKLQDQGVRVDDAPRGRAAGSLRGSLNVALVGGGPLGQQIVRQWLRQVSPAAGIAAFHGPDDLLATAATDRRPDLIVGVLLHTRPTPQTFEALRPLVASGAGSPVVVVAAEEAPHLVAAALRRGIRGYITTSLPPAVAAAAVKLVLLGGIFAPPAAAPDAAGQGAPPPKPAATGGAESRPAPSSVEAAAQPRLSPRERQVLDLLRMGLSNRMIAADLRISQNTVMVHVRHLMRKLGATNRTQAVFRARVLTAEGEDGGI